MATSTISVNELQEVASQNKPTHEAVVDFKKPHDFVDIGHSQLAYWSVGKGPNLVLVHGWPLHSATYRHLLPYLSQRYTCHLFDLPGAGMTKTGENAPFGIRAHGESLLKAIQAKGISQYSLLGHDSGAAIMQFTASMDAENVVSMIMGDTETPGYHSTLMALLILVSKIPFAPNLLFKSLRFKSVRYSNVGLGSCFTDPSYMDGEFSDLFVKPLLESTQVRGWQSKLLQNFNEQDIRELIQIQKNIVVPVQLLWGSDDQFFLLDDAKKMQRRFRGESELHVFEGGKLFIHEDHAERFAQHALAFLALHQPV